MYFGRQPLTFKSNGDSKVISTNKDEEVRMASMRRKTQVVGHPQYANCGKLCLCFREVLEDVGANNSTVAKYNKK
jgi:hypothetical protein